MVVAAASAGFFCFVELAFGCSSFVRHSRRQSGNGDETNTETSCFYGVWQHHGGIEANDNVCQPYTMSTENREAATDPSVLLLARVCSVLGILCSVVYMLFLSSIVCTMYPRSTVRFMGGCAGILMILLTVVIVISGLWSRSMLCLQETTSTAGTAEWLTNYATNMRCSVRHPQKVIWFHVLCWGVAGLGTRWLGESSLRKCRFRGRNVANACRVDTNAKEGDASVLVFGGDEEVKASDSVPPSLGDILFHTSQREQ